MWLKLCLLLIYITVLFILARLLEAVSWYETGALSKRLLDPMTLSVMKLKALLEQRGVVFEGVVLEKKELTELVEGSGPVTDEDVEGTIRDEELSPVTNFSSGEHFFEQVEDAKDSVWLIQVYSHHGEAVLGDQRWKALRKKMARFGVRAGILDCSLDQRYCIKRNWMTRRLLLALPSAFEVKGSVTIHSYSGTTKTNLIYEWIREKLDGKVEQISSLQQFQEDWLTYKTSLLNPEIRTVFFSNQKAIPMFYSALSVKFPGRVKFGSVWTQSANGKEIMKYMVKQNLTKVPIPSYVILTAEDFHLYGTKNGESLTYSSMESYLKTLYPCLNDIFIISFIIANVLSLFELCLVQGTLYRRLKKFLWYFVKCNIVLIMLWLPIVGIFQLPYLDKVPLWMLKFLRMFSTTSMATNLRKDLTFYTMHSSVLASIFIAYTMLVGFIEYKRKGGEEEEAEDEDYWNFAQMRTLEHLVRPADPLRDLETGILSRSTSLIWSRIYSNTRVMHTHIQDLPRWKYAVATIGTVSFEKSEIASTLEQDVDSDTPSSKEKKCQDASSVPESQDSDLEPNPPCPTDRSQSCKMTEHNTAEPETRPSTCHRNTTDRTEFENGTTTTAEPCFPDGFLPSNQCVICLDDYVVGVMLCGLPCSHSFHEQCIVTWLGRGNYFCPVCRWPAFETKSCAMHLHSE